MQREVARVRHREVVRQHNERQHEDCGRHEQSGDDELRLERRLNRGDAARWRDVGGQERRQQAHDDAYCGHTEREHHGSPVVAAAKLRDGGHDKGGAGGLGKGAKEISAHASNVSDVVAHVVCAARAH